MCKRHRYGKGIVCVALLLFGLILSLPVPAEELKYRASYRGIFSAGSEMAIADVVLRNRVPSLQSAYAETGMTASSANYGYVEALYPIRYRFRSWYRRDEPGVLASEYLESGRPDDIEHKLVFLDRAEAPFVTRNIQADSHQLSRLERGKYRPRTPTGENRAFDRLGLLQHLRGQDLKPGKVVEAQVTNGSEMLFYRVKVEKAEQLTLAGTDWNALKVRLDGLETDRHGRERHAHRPVFIWFSDDSRHLPLLAESRHQLGRFRVELVSAPAPTQVAVR